LASHPEGEEIDHVPAGQEVDVSFQIKITLLPGTYFGNAGVLGMDGNEMVFLHRCIDACMFRVQPRAGMLLTGMIDVSAGKPGSVSITPQSIHHVAG
jgi:lipopolysaccharide transport system ATP-binding protein